MQVTLEDIKDQLDKVKQQIDLVNSVSAGSNFRLWLLEEIAILGRTEFRMFKGDGADNKTFADTYQEVYIRWGSTIGQSMRGAVLITATLNKARFDKTVMDYVLKLGSMGRITADERNKQMTGNSFSIMIELDDSNFKHCAERFKLIVFLAERGYRATDKDEKELGLLKQRLVDSTK